jgi:hypothetical protein
MADERIPVEVERVDSPGDKKAELMASPKKRGPYKKHGKSPATSGENGTPGGVSAETAKRCFKELVKAVRTLRDPSADRDAKRAALDDYFDTSLEMIGEKYFGSMKYVEEVNFGAAVVLRGGFAAYEYFEDKEKENITVKKTGGNNAPSSDTGRSGVGQNNLPPPPTLPNPVPGSGH